MPYNYNEMKPWLFSDEGQRCLLRTRDNALKLLAHAGAFVATAPLADVNYGDSYKGSALIDRMVELGDIQEVTKHKTVASQHRVFVSAR